MRGCCRNMSKNESLPIEGKVGCVATRMRWELMTIASQSTPHQSLRDSFPSRESLKKICSYYHMGIVRLSKQNNSIVSYADKPLKGSETMKKITVIILVLLLIFALIRITTSTYENINRRNSTQAMAEFG